MDEQAMPAPGDDFAQQVLQTCIQRGRDLLEFQRPAVEAGNYDFMPDFTRTLTEFYLIGVMWRYQEQFDMPTTPRDRAFICLMGMLILDGASKRAAKRRIQYLNSCSRDEKGEDTLALSVGYKAGDREGALAKILDVYRDKPEIAGARQREARHSLGISGFVSVASLSIALLFDRSWGVAIGVGLVAGIAVLVASSMIYEHRTKSHDG